MEKDTLVVFQSKDIRRTWFNEEWYYSVVDVVAILTDSVNPRDYWYKTKKRLGNEEKAELSTICLQLKLEASDEKLRETDCANNEGIFRIIQSIPSKKAEPFKRWLAKIGKERIEEIENPELAQARMKEIYSAKGYPKDWIDKRLRGMAIRQNLTDEWQERGIQKQKDFAILTAEISKATFGMTPTEYKEHKNLPKQSKTNLRDHMNDLELIFNMLGERVTTEISQQEKPDSFNENKEVAKRGGKVAGNARKDTEKELGRPVTTKENYLPNVDKKKLIEED
ncbi:phage antirepressor protein [Candidatus Woesearchaeota archaeon]|jgi:DNA-damage-inducible protein D|nr:phage antirepressor protein [Candidatus Woesearchaeota archaeon]MBT5739759.1 phage antirepressor protein [Candidatus Woesearchaeota archaeon]